MDNTNQDINHTNEAFSPSEAKGHSDQTNVNALGALFEQSINQQLNYFQTSNSASAMDIKKMLAPRKKLNRIEKIKQNRFFKLYNRI